MTFSTMEIPTSPTNMASACTDSTTDSRESPTEDEEKLPIHHTGHSNQTSKKGGTSTSKNSTPSLTVKELLQFAIRKSVTENDPTRDGRKRTHSNEINPFEEVKKKHRKEMKFVETGVKDLKLEDEKT